MFYRYQNPLKPLPGISLRNDVCIVFDHCGYFVPLYLDESPFVHSQRIDRLRKWVTKVKQLNALLGLEAKWDNSHTSIMVIGLEWGIYDGE